MTAQDKKDFVEILATALNSQKPEPLKKERDMESVVVKGILSLSLLLIVWIFSTTNDLKQDVAIIKQNYEHTTKSLNDMKSFTEAPRFTKDDFQSGISPLINNVNTNSVKLNNQSAIQQSVESRLVKLEYQMDEFQDFKKN